MEFSRDLPTTPYISLIYRFHAKFLNNKVKDVNITYGLYPFLIEIYKHDGISQEDLANLFYLNESTVTRNLNKLEKRKKIISLTDDGVAIAKKVMDYDEKWDDLIKKDLSEDEYINFKKTLIKVCEAII